MSHKIDAKQQKVEYVYEDDLQFPAQQSRRLREIRKYRNTGTIAQPQLVEDLCQRVEMFYDGEVPQYDGTTYAPGHFDYGITTAGNGRLTGVRYRGMARPGPGCPQIFVEQYASTNYGAMVRKRLETVAEYDGEGRLKWVTYPVTGRKVQYGFNDRGLPSTLTEVTPGAPVPTLFERQKQRNSPLPDCGGPIDAPTWCQGQALRRSERQTIKPHIRIA